MRRWLPRETKATTASPTDEIGSVAIAADLQVGLLYGGAGASTRGDRSPPAPRCARFSARAHIDPAGSMARPTNFLFQLESKPRFNLETPTSVYFAARPAAAAADVLTARGHH